MTAERWEDVMKRSIFDRKIENQKFKTVYDEVSAKMSIGEQIAESRLRPRIGQEARTKIKS